MLTKALFKYFLTVNPDLLACIFASFLSRTGYSIIMRFVIDLYYGSRATIDNYGIPFVSLFRIRVRIVTSLPSFTIGLGHINHVIPSSSAVSQFHGICHPTSGGSFGVSEWFLAQTSTPPSFGPKYHPVNPSPFSPFQ